MEMDTHDIPLTESGTKPLEDGYFYCPNCGEIDLEFFEDLLVKRIDKEQYKLLSEEQKSNINQKFEYGVLLCEHCYNKAKRISWLIRGLYLLAVIMLSVNPMVAFCLVLVTMYIKRYEITRDFDFDHAWKCGAVRRVQSD